MSPPDIRLSKSDRTAARTDSKACGRTQRTKARYRAQVLPRLRAGQDGVHRRRPTTSAEEILGDLEQYPLLAERVGCSARTKVSPRSGAVLTLGAIARSF